MFEFQDLCGRPVAAADYIALCNEFHTIAVSNVPVFNAANRAMAYRFVTLVDVMYEHRWEPPARAAASWQLCNLLFGCCRPSCLRPGQARPQCGLLAMHTPQQAGICSHMILATMLLFCVQNTSTVLCGCHAL